MTFGGRVKMMERSIRIDKAIRKRSMECGDWVDKRLRYRDDRVKGRKSGFNRQRVDVQECTEATG
jgi:hypothetical protein